MSHVHDCHRFQSTISNPDVLVGEKLVKEAHRRQLRLHPWTLRTGVEDPLVDKYFDGNPFNENKYMMDIGVDGYFTEIAGPAVCARDDYVMRTQRGPVVSAGFVVGSVIGAAFLFAAIGSLATYIYFRKRLKYNAIYN